RQHDERRVQAGFVFEDGRDAVRVRGRRRVVVHHCRRTPGDDRGRRAAVVDRRDRELPFRGARRVALEPIVDLRRVRANIVLRVFLRRLQVRETGRSGNGGHARSGGLVPQPLRQLVVGQPDVLVDAVSTGAKPRCDHLLPPPPPPPPTPHGRRGGTVPSPTTRKNPLRAA